MEKEFEDIKFKYSFRDYQKEALDLLDKYKNDEKIHVVAAPGAGKTILALELLIRIGNKALILAPTIAIKEQWIERLKKDFENGDKVDFISTDLESPKCITVITYQSLYSLNRKKVNIENIIKKNKIKTLVLDEAHHLRKVWFKTLENIINNLKDCTTISLTATPPYDNGNDYKNYMSLCGDIDAIITVPQLVRSNCLCPHQDYIYFNTPTEVQNVKFFEFQKNINFIIEEIKHDSNFIKAIALNDYIVMPEENVNSVLENFDFYIAMLSFLSEVKCKIPNNFYTKNVKVPKFNKDLMEILLEKLLFDKEIEEREIFKDTFDNIKNKLNKLGCIEEKTVNLKYSKELSDIILKNTNKLDSIDEIINIEYTNLKEKLKLVVVTDYIKDNFYDVDEEEINEIGVIPIFRKVISNCMNAKVSVLTGTTIIIPTDTKEKLLKIAKEEFNIESNDIKISEIGIDFNYSNVEIEDKYKRYTVNLITKLFEKTDINVLIGTVALIGEGWDAPFINSLIMASFVASYVTSNQVRGRAIRIDKSNLKKISNIWHLVCLEKENDKYVLGEDYKLLSRRFTAYEGLRLLDSQIDSGIERLNIDNKSYTLDEIKSLNNVMIENSKNRSLVEKRWRKALEGYTNTCSENFPIEKLYKNKNGRYITNSKNIYRASKIGIDIGIIYAAGALIQPGVLLLLFANNFIFDKLINAEKKYIEKICRATYFSLIDINKIGNGTRFQVEVIKDRIIFRLRNANTYEQMLFIKCVKEAMTLDYNSRYIIDSVFAKYSVPELFSKNKNDAEIFHRHFLGSNLIYTKSKQGEKLLLKYKMKQFK